MIGPLVGLLSGLVSAGSQVGNFYLSQYQKDKENRYNSPAAQMHRLRNAGINPYAAISQVAGQNQGSMAQPEFDFGKSFSDAVNNYSRVTETELNVAETQKRLEKFEQDIRSMFLDNYYKGMSMQDRLKTVGNRAIQSMYDADYSMSNADIRWLESEWQRALAGIENTVYDPVLSPRMQAYNYDLTQKEVAAGIAEDTQKYKTLDVMYNTYRNKIAYEIEKSTKKWKIDYEKFKTLKTEQDYKIACQTLIRETVAADYENLTHMPFTTRDIWSHLISKVIDTVKKMPKDISFKDFWKFLWDNL